MRHLLEIRRHVRVVASEVDVVEDEADDVLDAVAELTGRPGLVMTARPVGGRAVGERERPACNHARNQ